MSKNYSSNSSCENNRAVYIQMDVHLVGGYNDPKGSSNDLTNDIMNVLNQISSSFKNNKAFDGNENEKTINDRYCHNEHCNSHSPIDNGTCTLNNDAKATKKRKMDTDCTNQNNLDDKDLENHSTQPSQQLQKEEQRQKCEPVIRMILQTCIITKLNDVVSYEYHRSHNDNDHDDENNNGKSMDASKSTTQTAKDEKASATSKSRTTSSWDFQHAPDYLYDEDEETNDVEPTMYNLSSSLSKSKPIIRGVAFYLRSNKLVLLNHNITPSLHGPERILRAVRLWSSSPNGSSGSSDSNNSATTGRTNSNDPCNHELSLVHSFEKDRITIKRFDIEPFDGMVEFMNLPDNLILQYGSTSPECEDDGFCDMMRKKCQFVLSLSDCEVTGCSTTVVGQSSSVSPTEKVFGHSHCLEYKVGDFWNWKICDDNDNRIVAKKVM